MKLLCITGGSQGLGAALVDVYQGLGWHVCEFSRSGSSSGHIGVDLAAGDAASVADQAFSQLASQPWEEVLLINNAGMLSPLAPVSAISDEAIAFNLNVNFNSAIRIIAAFIRHFGDTAVPKTLVQISSGAALRGYGSWSLYCASKAGLEHFIRALAAEQSLARYPVTCVNFDPGVMDTEMQAEIRSRSTAEFPDVGRYITRKQQGLLRQPQDVAAALVKRLAASPQGGERYSVEDVL
jgi:benzil reductase ((S)-benzoin forming)